MIIYSQNHYLNPTAATAPHRAPDYPRVFICSAYRNDPVGNTQRAVKYSRFAFEQGYMPLAPHLLFPQFMDDTDPDERREARWFGMRLMAGCEELWAFGEITEGMRSEIEGAADLIHEIRIRYFTIDMKEMHHHG
ncbi:hypothetical protein AGMMS49992_11760 [Clostridia bacterium]|nr:hypothetical protein AGMMS49992_11760 [Clostridia bacterium]